MQKLLMALATAIGLALGILDTRSNWDDTGAIAMAVLVSCAALGVVSPARPWLWALAVGIWLPVLNIALAGNFGSLLALAFAFAGAYAGMAARVTLARAKDS
jgi:hypothetical protein